MEDQEGEREIQESKENSGGKLSWIVCKGLTLGKRALVTGFVVSSAPLLLPPLLVFSTIGLACSVPCGILYASYACTQKLMSKLLPITAPPPPLFLEFGAEDDQQREELVDDERNEEEKNVSNEDSYLQRGFKGELVGDESEIVEVNGYEEDVGEWRDEAEVKIKEEEPAIEESINVGNENSGVMIVIEGDEIGGSNVKEEEAPNFEVRSVVVELCEGKDNKENEEPERETRGLIEKIRDEGEADIEVIEKDRQKKRHLEDKNTYESVWIEEPMRAMKRAKEQNGVKGILPESVVVELVNKETILPGGQVQDNAIAKQDSQWNGGRKMASSSYTDVREIADEGGIHLFDEKKAASLQDSADYRTPEGSEHTGYRVHEFAGSFEATLPSRVPKSKLAPIPTGENTDVASNKMQHGDEKLWKQIEAMRTIVGYTAAPHASYVEEIKALYLFTGVEPPASFKDPSDQGEVNDKIRFLMTIVGVK